MATHRRPPVIPEIAKAYQNDPRTQLAMQALATGSSVAPVAEGKYAAADGIARVLTGLGGAYMNKKQMDGYQGDEAELLALRKARGADGISGAPPVQNAGQIATALGAPPAQAPAGPQSAPPGPQGMPGLPMAPVPPPQAPGGPTVQQGAGPGGRPPFGPSAVTPPRASTPAFLAPPPVEAVPDAPAPVARPNAPQAVGATRSKLLDAAYRIMDDGNAYESARGQDMYVEGMADQTKLDESATERRQRLIDMGYQTDLGAFSEAQSQDRGAAYEDRRGAQNRNFQGRESFLQRGFQAHESAADRAAAMERERFSANAQAASQERMQRFQQAQGDRDFEHQKVLQTLKTGADRKDYAQKYLGTKAGHAQITELAKTIGAVSNQVAILDAFEQTLPKTKTGGLLLGNAPGLVKWSNSNLQKLDSYTQALVANNAKMLPGALSDKEGARLEAMGPSIKKTRSANQDQITFLKGVAKRQKTFALGQAHALRNGEDIDFLDNWSAYTDSVPVTSNMTYDQFMASVPKYDANGNRVK